MRPQALYFIIAIIICACGAEKSATTLQPIVASPTPTPLPAGKLDTPFTRFEGLWGVRNDTDHIMMDVSGSTITYTAQPKTGPKYVYRVEMYYRPGFGLPDGRVQIEVTGLRSEVTVLGEDAAALLNKRGDCNRRDWTIGIHELTGTCGTAKSGARGYGMYLVQGTKLHLASPAIRSDGSFAHDSDAHRNTDLSGPEMFKYGN